MAADITATLTEATCPAFTVNAFTSSTVTPVYLLDSTYGRVATQPDLAPGGSGGGSTRPTTGFLYPRKV